MNMRLLPQHLALNTAGRFRLPPRSVDAPISAGETLALLGCGAAAAAGVMLVEFNLKLPGHSILRAVFPFALGLSLVPRRGAGTVMGGGAVATAAILIAGGWGDRGLGSLTSLALIGPVLDLAMRGSANGRRIYYSFIAAGIVTNLAAMSVQASAKYLGLDNAGIRKGLAAWLPLAIATYPLCGALAGLISAAAWFRWNSEASRDAGDGRS